MTAQPDEGLADELEHRVRALEAERLRPVPGAPIPQKRPTTAAEIAAARREAHDLHKIEEHLADVALRRAVLEELEADDEDTDPTTDPEEANT